MWTIYMHKNKKNRKVYIGVTGQIPEYRWGVNGNGYHDGRFRNAINKYGWEGFEHIILYEGLTKEGAERHEVRLIQKYDSTHRDKGYNNAVGGGVNSGFHFTHSDQARGKKRSAKRTRPMTDEHRSAISKYHKGKVVPDEVKNRISNTQTALRGSQIDQYSTDGVFIRRWESISEAARTLGIDRTLIIVCCKGRQQKTHDMCFRYVANASSLI